MSPDKFQPYLDANEYTNLKQDTINQLITENIGLVKSIILRMEIHLPYGIDKEDLIGIGNWGLIDAAKKFDPSKKTKFKTFAYIKIRGAILDEIRKHSFGGQSIMRKNKQLYKVYQKLEQNLNRMPHEDEVAEELNISIDQLEKMINDTKGAYLLSLDEPIDNEKHITKLDALFEDSHYLEDAINKEKLNMITQAIKGLPKKNQITLSLYYEKELSLKEISVVLGVSESRICQIHKQSVLYIKSYLNNKYPT